MSRWYNVRVKGMSMSLEEHFLDYTIKILDWKWEK